MNFTERLLEGFDRTSSIVCVGLDPVVTRMPLAEPDNEEKIVRYFASLVDAMASQGLVHTVKPNYAFFAQYGFPGLRALKEIIELCQENNMIVILDAKRGDIGATSEAYAKEAFEFFEADAVTVSPYMGRDSIEPFLKYCDRGKGVYVLAKTSNPGSRDFEDLQCDGQAIYAHVVEKFCDPLVDGTGFVVGATHPNELKGIQEMLAGKRVPLLIPGIGAQGASVKDTLAALGTSDIGLHRINSSSAIIYAHEKAGKNYVDAALEAIKRLHEEIHGGD